METSRTKRFVPTLLTPKVGIPLLIAVIVLSLPLIIRGYMLRGMPDIGDPFDVEKYGTIEIDPAENAYTDYIAAGKLLVPLGSYTGDIQAALDGDWSGVDATLRKWLEDNRPALAVWRSGTTKPDAVLVQPGQYSISSLLPSAQETRDFTRLARLECLRLEAEGDFAGAWGWYRDMLRCSRHLGRHGSMIERLLGIANHSVASRGIVKWSDHPEVTAEQLRLALDELQEIYRNTPTVSAVLRAEYFMVRNSLDSDYLLEEFSRGGIPKSLGRLAMFASGEPELGMRLIRQICANALEQADKPRWERPPRVGKTDVFETPAGTTLPPGRLTAAEINEHFPRSIVARFFRSAIAPFDNAITAEQARQVALEMALAAQIYRRIHGTYPATAAELTGHGLADVPIDPFSPTGAPMQYRRDAEGAVAWSIGMNGVDDSGRVGASNKEADIGYVIGPQPKPPAETAP